MADKPDPKDFMLQNMDGQTLTRLPGQINGYDFVIANLNKCNVYLLDYSAQITIDDCYDCNFYMGPVEGSIFFRDCENCTVSASSAQFRMKNCKGFDCYLFAASDPSIEYSENLRFAPLNLSYPDQDLHFRSAKLDMGTNYWSQVFDFNKKEGETHWSLLPPDEFMEKSYPQEGMNSPVNPISRSTTYGGTDESQIIVGSQAQSDNMGDIQSFDFSATQEQAEAMIASQSDDPFGSATPIDDDPFSSGGPSAGDPFGSSQQGSDPFSGPPVFEASSGAEPFMPSAEMSQMSMASSETDEEELERQRQRELENQLRMQALYEREEAERRTKDEKRNTATEQLAAWLAQRNKSIESKKDYNRQQEQVFAEAKKAGTAEASWKRVVTMIDFKEQTDAKDRTRLRSVLMAKKSEG